MAKDRHINLRLDAEWKRLLEAASVAEGSSISAFILDAATLATEQALADRTVFRLGEDQWAAFDELLNRPARDLPKLRELLGTPTILDEPPGSNCG
ncbi:DUF1778 domain-containing protein [Streptosporangium subroseum]|uniref:type II toxin-antitoxin system TacA family antitoxin n=1 Tax=Streptosporangium subroseum TaxID=106412 RepID=UPI00342FCA8C